MPQKNPTSYDFAHELADLRLRALAALELERQLERPIFALTPATKGLPTGTDLNVLVASTSHEPLFGSDLLELPPNRDDLYLQNFHRPLWESPVYRAHNGQGLKFLAEFHVHFEPIGENRTRVKVTARRTEVINGEYLGLAHSGLGWLARYVSVAPTSIEEFLVLKYIADFVGVSLPEPILPVSGRSSTLLDMSLIQRAGAFVRQPPHAASLATRRPDRQVQRMVRQDVDRWRALQMAHGGVAGSWPTGAAR